MRVIMWAEQVSTEQRVALDLPWEGLQELLDLMIDLNGAESTLAAVKKKLPAIAGTIVNVWRNDGLAEADIHRAVASAARDTKVFKQVDPGEQLGNLVARFLPAIPGSDLSLKLAQIAAWCYEG
ncbi:MAG: hypothetical protein ACREK6_00925 [Candidatus Rokuibacteriota bacterium]